MVFGVRWGLRLVVKLSENSKFRIPLIVALENLGRMGARTHPAFYVNHPKVITTKSLLSQNIPAGCHCLACSAV